MRGQLLAGAGIGHRRHGGTGLRNTGLRIGKVVQRLRRLVGPLRRGLNRDVADGIDGGHLLVVFLGDFQVDIVNQANVARELLELIEIVDGVPPRVGVNRSEPDPAYAKTSFPICRQGTESNISKGKRYR
ncbi:MAG TPA: hypothetical protein VFW56_08390 [Bradyrhizobium sp.]|nr:hypothetical protein [Bradyrhizobium sp.]